MLAKQQLCNNSILKIFIKKIGKSGIELKNSTELYDFIAKNCTSLHCDGVMTIGKYGFDTSTGLNPDFVALMNCHKDICDKYNLHPNELNVSMGMSSDFEQAVNNTK